MSKLEDMLGADKLAEVLRREPATPEKPNVSETATYQVINLNRADFNAMVERLFQEYDFFDTDDAKKAISDDDLRGEYQESYRELLNGIMSSSLNATSPDGSPLVRVTLPIEDFMGIFLLLLGDRDYDKESPDYAADLGKF